MEKTVSFEETLERARRMSERYVERGSTASSPSRTR